MDQLGRCEPVRRALQDRKCSLLLIVSVLALSFLTFLCEQEILRTVCASSYIDETYEDKVRLKTSDAGIFVGLKQTMEIPVKPPMIKSGTVSKDRIFDGRGLSKYNSSESHIASGDIDSHGNLVESEKEDPLSFEGEGVEGSQQQGSGSEGTEFLTDEELQKTYYVFKGIPYAKPPVGNLRWKDPEVLDIKSAAQDNTKYKSICSQWSKEEKRVVGSQDCLYLNIFTPHLPLTLRRPFLPNPYTVQDTFYQRRHLYPVLIYVHGGDLISGSGNFYGAHKLLKNEDVVLVTFNYRLGIFGFLSAGDGEIAGNFGLLDQISAIKWIQKYIQRFGGNPTRMTVFGDVGYLLFSPLAVGLFQGAIWTSSSTSLFSPPANKSSDWSSSDHLTKEIATAVGCPATETNISKETLSCLKLTPVDDLIRAQQSQMKFHSYPRRYSPVVDVSWRDFPVMIDKPENLVQMGTLVKVPVVAGVNHIEGYDMLLDFRDKIGGYDNLRDVDKVKETLRENLRFILEGDSDAVYDVTFEAIWKHYFGEPGQQAYTRGLTKKLILLFGDIKCHAGFWTLTQNLTRNVKPPVYAYVFSHKTSEFASYFREEAPNKRFNSLGNDALLPWQDLYYVLSAVDDSPAGANATDSQGASMELIMAEIWTSFSKYGTPKEAVSKFENWTKWRPLERNHNRLYDLSRAPGPMKTTFRNSEALFWVEELPQIRAIAIQSEESQQYYATLFWITIIVTLLVFLLLAAIVVHCVCFR